VTKKVVHQVLSERDHIRARPGMWVGDISLNKRLEWIYNLETKRMEKRNIEYIPALVKCFSEILDNSIDESRRHPDTLTMIKVNFEDDGSIIVLDNGKGIPVEKYENAMVVGDVIDSKLVGKYVPEVVFTNLRAGSNFDDTQDQQLIGTHGVGSSCVVVLSSEFKIETCDGKNSFTQTYLDGMAVIKKPVVKEDEKNRTKITFTPDYKFFNQNGLSADNKLRMIKKIVDAAANNLSVKFYVSPILTRIGTSEYLQALLGLSRSVLSILWRPMRVALMFST
jgi:DNA topoisomerase-2